MLPSGNILIVGGNMVANGDGGSAASQDFNWQVYNPTTTALSYKRPMPSTIIYDAVPNAL